MDKQDYYDLLGISKSASDAEIKKAYRTLAMKYHPDRNPGNKEAEIKFREVTEAYEILKDDQKRAAYDRYGHAAFAQGAGAGAGFGGFNFDFGSGGGFGSIFEDIFGEFMGAAGRRSQRYEGERGEDIRYDLEISLEEAYSGVKKEIEIQSSEKCEECEGSGAQPGTKAETCEMCHGTGRIRRQSGFFIEERMCPTCRGTGKVIKTPCKKCGGSGKQRKNKTVDVTIPAGIKDQQILNVSGRGNSGTNGGPAGDLHVYVNVRPHPVFERRGDDVWCEVPITFTQAALGADVVVPTLDGKVSYTVREGTQPGDVFRLKGKGIQNIRSKARGDQLVRIIVDIPTKLNSEQREALLKFNSLMGGSTPTGEEKKGFFGKKRK